MGNELTSETVDLGFVALAHDYLNQNGGAERVVLEMAAMWPQAPIYTSLDRPGSTLAGFGDYEVVPSPLDRLPVDRGFRGLLAFYPAAFAAFGTLAHDVVISSSSGWAHSVRTLPETFHAVYCHTPARWLYGGEHLGDTRREQALKPVIDALRRWGRGRCGRRGGAAGAVAAPPGRAGRFRPSERGDRLLVVSRLLPYKRVDT